ncbi:T9SS type A sorting domain-containing protein [uncultured Kordia sp.]|uniref:T9SS type A sorting domain-containing protein n=1 Tax=uncultured Kordia sp. TaxID=507699 RepID=UPI00261B9B07|nr:T9SS type A sorting domain-containing protein [uncultured Kordia sp.]
MKTKLFFTLLLISLSVISYGQNRSQGGNNNQLITPEDSSTDGRISLRLSGNGSFMTILLGFIPGGTINYDDGFDGTFINDGAVLEFYSMLGTTKLSIQALPELAGHDVEVPLGYELTAAETYTLSIDAEFLDPDFDIILEDRYEGLFTDLRQTNYSFTGMVGEFNNRFFLKLDRRASLGVEDIHKNLTSLHAYFTNDLLTIHTKQTNFKTVELFNISGKRIITTDFANEITVNSLVKGIYILRCTDISGAVSVNKLVK